MTHRVKRDLGKIKQEVFDQNVHDYKDDAYKHRGVTGFDDNFGALPDMSNVGGLPVLICQNYIQKL